MFLAGTLSPEAGTVTSRGQRAAVPEVAGAEVEAGPHDRRRAGERLPLQLAVLAPRDVVAGRTVPDHDVRVQDRLALLHVLRQVTVVDFVRAVGRRPEVVQGAVLLVRAVVA